ncbi:DUF1853 family protein [Vibrio hippocampi]|uniref:DUF1853 family protein n=1 Tax=Vibrio hippocampi TaxID=654686 RepID=A0ABM8ZF06_9VIBR|nr:DUF1853 family protein [Vibrio hippocampi]CAH0525105.1 hypothetical protein VHP8226_00771 [Vibrio hippocampi]
MNSLNPTPSLTRFYEWILTTPSLIHAVPPSVELISKANDKVNIVECLPITASNLRDLPDTYEGNRRLGFLYQELCRRLFDLSSEHNVVAEEVQLQENGQTQGAIDFLIENSQQQVEHWEVAIKFYLLYDGIWYGPNSQDQLDKKLSRMLTHQLMMSERASFREQFPDFTTVSKHLLLQGRLYINPFRAETIPSHCLEYPITTNQINGFWCHYRDADKIESPLYSLSKDKWAVGEVAEERGKRQPHKMIPDRINHCQDQQGQFWFVLPDTWPFNHQHDPSPQKQKD